MNLLAPTRTVNHPFGHPDGPGPSTFQQFWIVEAPSFEVAKVATGPSVFLLSMQHLIYENNDNNNDADDDEEEEGIIRCHNCRVEPDQNNFDWWFEGICTLTQSTAVAKGVLTIGPREAGGNLGRRWGQYQSRSKSATPWSMNASAGKQIPSHLF